LMTENDRTGEELTNRGRRTSFAQHPATTAD
jgi:hypothetical protein